MTCSSPGERFRTHSKHFTSPCVYFDQRLDELIQETRREVLLAYRKTKDITRRERAINCPGLVKIAFKWLQRGRWGISPTDKDAGYCLPKKDVLDNEVYGLMASEWFRARMNVQETSLLKCMGKSAVVLLAWSAKARRRPSYTAICCLVSKSLATKA